MVLRLRRQLNKCFIVLKIEKRKCDYSNLLPKTTYDTTIKYLKMWWSNHHLKPFA